jgi:hypothetical protein
MTFAEVQALFPDQLHLALAIHCDGQTPAGVFRDVTLMHPPGIRTASHPVADYTGDWNHVMRLALRYQIEILYVPDMETRTIDVCLHRFRGELGDDDAPLYAVYNEADARRRICELALGVALHLAQE